MADRYRDDDRSNSGSADTRYPQGNRDDQRSDYGYGRAGGSGYGNDRDTRAGYSGYEGRDYQDRYSQRGFQGEGAQGRNWAERAGDEVKSWVGDDEAERRRQQDAQKLGRYPGDDRGQDGYRAGRDSNYGSQPGYGRSQYGEPAYGQGGDYSSSRYSQGQGYDSRTTPTSGASSGDYAQSGYRRDTAAGAYGQPSYDQGGSGRSGGYGVRQSSYTPSNYSAYDDRGSNNYTGAKSMSRDNWASNNTSYNPDDRGFMSKAGDEVKSWFGDEDAERRRQLDAARDNAGNAFRGSGSTNQQSLGYTGSTSADISSVHHDPDYQSYRKGWMDEYDRDYHEYRQSKQQAFHDDFNAFRTQKSSANNTDGTGIGTSSGTTSGTAKSDTSGATSAAMGVGAGVAAYGASTSGSSGTGAGYGASSSTGSSLTGAAAQVKEHMVVDGSDGQGIGKVDHIQGSDIKLTKHDSTDGKHHLIPMSWVASVEGNKVKLNKTSDEAMKQWRVAEPAQGSGTVGTKTQA